MAGRENGKIGAATSAARCCPSIPAKKKKNIPHSMLDIYCKACYSFHAKQTIHKSAGDGMKTSIPELRKQRRLTQEELALAVGVTRQTITSLEVGKYTASLVLAYKIARYFGKSIEEVFDFSEAEER
jgi:putative transcriptional regulator